MADRQIRINDRLYLVHDWSERFQPSSEIHACGKPIVGTFSATVPKSVGIGAVVRMEEGERSAIVDEEEPGQTGEFLVQGSILAAGAGPLAEPSAAPPPADLPCATAR